MNRINPLAVGSRIASSRVEANLTQERLGELIGVSGSCICHYERGEIESLNVILLERIANVFDIPLNNLLYSQRGNNPDPDKLPTFTKSFVTYRHIVEYNNITYEMVATKDITYGHDPDQRAQRSIIDLETGDPITDPSLVEFLNKSLTREIHRLKSERSRRELTENTRELPEEQIEEE